jgi:hypothetical protein
MSMTVYVSFHGNIELNASIFYFLWCAPLAYVKMVCYNY